MYLLTFHAPESHVEMIKDALFDAGAGTIGQYARCAWQTLGEGQFLPLEGSRAFIGECHQLEKVSEYKVEMVCGDELIRQVIAALKQAHPYETPSYQVVKLEEGF